MNDEKTLGDYTPEQVMEVLGENKRLNLQAQMLERLLEVAHRETEELKQHTGEPPEGSVIIVNGQVWERIADLWFTPGDDTPTTWMYLRPGPPESHQMVRWGGAR